MATMEPGIAFRGKTVVCGFSRSADGSSSAAGGWQGELADYPSSCLMLKRCGLGPPAVL